MKLNENEKLAFKTMRHLLDQSEAGKTCVISAKESNAIFNTFGFELKELNFKKEIDAWVRGKGQHHIEVRKPFSPHGAENRIQKHYYFPYQIKKIKR
ncbi:MAG: hypothetical protein HOM11_05990 [Methylococcales bacterium]|jgi:hypothetical protein|nr:hypothetical protein [Methylococcales bacterium]